MKHLLSLLVVCLLSPVLRAGISGNVFAPDGTAVAGARVTAYRPVPLLEERRLAMAQGARPELARATTDAEGAFVLDTKAAGIVELLVERDGFAPGVDYALAGDAAVLVDLTPAAKRTGRVTADGKPVKGASVIATNGPSVLWSTVTGDDGTYAIADPKSWASEIAIVHPDYAPVTLDAEGGKFDAALVAGSSLSGTVVRKGRPVANARVSAGPWTVATTGEDGAFVLRHVAGDVKKIEAFDGTAFGSAARTVTPLAISVEDGHAIAGSVRDSENRPVPGAPVGAYSMRHGQEKWRDSNSAVSDEKGNFRLEHFEAGEYAVMAQGAGQLAFDTLTLSLRDAPTGRADLTAKKQEAVTGVVRDEQKRPVAGATVQYTMPQLPLVYGTARQGMQSARTAGNGTFRLPLPERMPENIQFSVQASRRGFAIATSEPVTRERRHLVITLPTGVELAGVVTDAAGAPVAKAGIIVLQDPSGAVPLPLDSALASGMVLPFAETDAEGKFSLRVNETKIHDVGVWKEGYAGARASSVRPGDPLKIVLERGAEIRGRVTRKAGAPITNGMIMASGEDASFARATVGSDGTFALTGLRPGTYMLQFNDGSASTEQQVQAPASDVVIELPETGTIAGRVIDAATREVLTRYDITAELPADMEMESVEGEDSFTMQLPAGPVELTARAEGYVNGVQQAQVEIGKTAEVTIALTPGRAAYGTVTDDDGTPVGEATLNVEDGPGITQSGNNGEFHLDSLPREAVTITVSANGLVEKKVELPAGAGDARLDVVLSRGRKASGRVVMSDGSPVEGAKVVAAGEPQQEATTGPDGRFTVSGLNGPMYMFQASREELESDFVPLGEGEIVLTMKPSAGAGAIHGFVEGFSEGEWMFGFVTAGDSNANAAIGRDGKFRIERVGAGEVELRAWAKSARAEASTAPVRVTVVPNGEVEVKLAFRTDVKISGTVYEGGAPAPGRKVSFQSEAGRFGTTTSETGAYTITGVEPGVLYQVEVEHGGRDFKTRYQVAGSATYDIRVEWAQVEGRVLDETGAPVSGAEIGLVTEERDSAGETKSDANGAFVLPAVRAAHVLTVARAGFATVTQRVEPAAAPLVIRMRRSDGLRVRITDARTGATLDGYAAAVDASGLQIAKSSEAQKDGTMLLPLAPGPYRIAVSADGYASQSARTAVPHEGEMRFALTPGGTLIVHASRPASDVVKLILANGEEYVRCHCNGIAEIRLSGLTTTIEHVAPGTYTMQVLDARGLVKTTYPVTVTEGQTVIAELNVPE